VAVMVQIALEATELLGELRGQESLTDDETATGSDEHFHTHHQTRFINLKNLAELLQDSPKNQSFIKLPTPATFTITVITKHRMFLTEMHTSQIFYLPPSALSLVCQ